MNLLSLTGILIGFRRRFGKVRASAKQEMIATQAIVDAVVQNTVDGVSLGAMKQIVFVHLRNDLLLQQMQLRTCTPYQPSDSIASRLAESGPYCCSRMFVCLYVCRPMYVRRSFLDLQPTTIDRSQPNLVCRYIPVLAGV